MIYKDFAHVTRIKAFELLSSELIRTEKWQGITPPEPMAEVLFSSFSVPMFSIPVFESDLNGLKPNKEWADLHFEERVGGKPTNPGETYMKWPWYKSDEHRSNGKFTHTYQERIWTEGHGNLNDLINLMKEQPLTRQAFLPIWFPDDTGVKNGGRVPCSIGYHFIQRHGYLHCTYYLRSCDFRRHFQDDMYLANRLAIWIRNKVNPELKMGLLRMDIVSLHCFQSDLYWIRKTFKNENAKSSTVV